MSEISFLLGSNIKPNSCSARKKKTHRSTKVGSICSAIPAVVEAESCKRSMLILKTRASFPLFPHLRIKEHFKILNFTTYTLIHFLTSYYFRSQFIHVHTSHLTTQSIELWV